MTRRHSAAIGSRPIADLSHRSRDIDTAAEKQDPLEDDLEAIETLDRYREKAKSWCNNGIEFLSTVFESDEKVRAAGDLDEKKVLAAGKDLDKEKRDAIAKARKREIDAWPEYEFWAEPRPSLPDDLSQCAIVFLALGRQPDLENLHRGKSKQVAKALETRLKEFDLKQLFRAPDSDGFRSNVHVLEASRVLQALVDTPGEGLSRAALLCYYRIIRELYSINPLNWTAGSARAADAGVPSAYATGECTRAISALARSLEHSAALIREVRTLADDMNALVENKRIPELWRSAELKRLCLSSFTTISNLALDSNIRIDRDLINELENDGPRGDEGIREFLSGFRKAAIRHYAGLLKEFEGATVEISAFRSEETQDRSGEDQTLGDLSRTYAHEVAFRALHGGSELIEAGQECFDSIDLANLSDSTSAKLEEFVKRLEIEARACRKVLNPAAKYIESILDREVAASSSDTESPGNPHELAFAAAAFAMLERSFEDPRLLAARLHLEDAISPSGELGAGLALDVDLLGYRLNVSGSEVLRALAQILEKTPVQVSPELIAEMLALFDRTGIRDVSGGEILGWGRDHVSEPRRASRWATALAVLALDRIVRMLDERINTRVFRHFSVRSNKELELKLPDLFCPDHGLAKKSPKNLLEAGISGRSVVEILEEMRGHVIGAPPRRGQRDGQFSLVMYGPPGTGKTTLVEALSASCGTSLVEVTPSDIVVAGEAAIERRARAVFRALSLLTRTVILFDEFDPVLRARDMADTGAPTVFSFLTPGMLPKLRRLNKMARKRQVAFVLITNRIGTLDDAAIRSGRFDSRIGVYPPDLVSRAGRLLYEVSVAEKSKGWTLDEAKIANIVLHSAGKGMSLLGRPGNFKFSAKSPAPEGSIMQYLKGDGDDEAFAWPPNDALFQHAIDRDVEIAQKEWRQWWWVKSWDDQARKALRDRSHGAGLPGELEIVCDLAENPPSEPDDSKPKIAGESFQNDLLNAVRAIAGAIHAGDQPDGE